MTTDTTITIRLNGEPRTLAGSISVEALVQDLGFRPEVVAVELDERLVRRDVRATTLVRDGDRVEIVTLVGGG